MKAMIRFQIQFLIALGICGFPCFAQTRSPVSKKPAQTQPGAAFLQQVKAYEETPYVTKIILKNGMTVLVNEFRVQPVVSMQLYVRAGFFDDPPQNPGLAALVRAVVQRGMPDKTGGTYRQKVQALGGLLRSATDYATSVFEIVAPSNQWKRALNAQCEAILNPSFDQDAVKLEAKLLQGEARGILDNPVELANEKLLELAFNQPRMGKYDTLSGNLLAAVTPDILSDFYKAFYTPARMMLVISGDVSSSEILNEVARLYIKRSGPAAKPSSFPFAGSQDEFRYSSIRGTVSTPSLFFGFHAVPENDEDSNALQVLSSIIGSGDASVLSLRIRDQKKLILSGQTQLAAYPEFGFLTIHVKANPAKIDQSELAILTELELLKRDEPTEAEMERALAQIERSYWAGLETVTARARALARFESLGDWKRMDRKIADLRKVKPSDVKRAAAKYLKLENCSLIEYLPSSGEERQLNAEGVRNTFSGLLAASADQEQAERNRETVLAVTIPPHTGTFKFSEVRYPLQTASILRGPDLFIREDHSNPLIEMGLFFPGGKLDEKKENAGITSLVTRLMLKGGTDVSQFYRQLEIYGGRVWPVVTDDYFGFYFSALSQNFEPAFKMLLETIRAPNFDKEEVSRQAEIQVSEIFAVKNSDAYPMELMDQSLFENFPYSLNTNGTEANVAALTPDSLKAWYDSHVKNRKPVVAVIGDTRGTTLASVFVQHFSGSRFQDTKLPADFAKELGKAKSADQKWTQRKGLILVGFQAPPEDDEDGYAVRVLQAYAGDPGRFSQELRDRLGVAYEVSIAYEPRLRGGSLIISAATNSGGEDDLLKALRDQIQQVRQGPIPYRDFRSSINEAVGAYSIRQQARSVQIGEIAENVLAGKGIEGYQNCSAGLQDVKEEDLKPLVQRLFDLDKAAVVTMRGTQ